MELYCTLKLLPVLCGYFYLFIRLPFILIWSYFLRFISTLFPSLVTSPSLFYISPILNIIPFLSQVFPDKVSIFLSYFNSLFSPDQLNFLCLLSILLYVFLCVLFHSMYSLYFSIVHFILLLTSFFLPYNLLFPPGFHCLISSLSFVYSFLPILISHFHVPQVITQQFMRPFYV